MTPEEKAAFIRAQTEMMINERQIMLAEDDARRRAGDAPANGPGQWADWHRRWEPVLGYNALLAFLQQT